MSERREQILRAGQEVAADEGIHAASVRRVAARAGVGASTLRYYFPTQQDLVDALLGPTLDDRIGDLRIADASLPAAERLAECLRQFLPATAGEVPQLERWLSAYAAAFGTDGTSSARTVLTALTARGRIHVEGWLDRLDAEGTLRPEARDHAATVLLALVDGLCLELLTPGSPVGLADAHRALDVVITTSVVRAAETA